MNLFRPCKTGLRHATRLALVCISCLYAIVSQAQGLELLPEEATVLDSFEHALDTARSEKLKVGIRYNIALYKGIYSTGFWDSLIYDAHKAEAIETELGASVWIGYYLNMQGEARSAIMYLQRAVYTAMAAGLWLDLFDPMYHLTDAYFVQGDIKNALDYGFSALKVAEQTQNKRNIVLAYSQLSRIYARIGYPQKALRLYLQALRLTEKNNLGIELEALTVFGVATDYYELKDTANALKYFSRCGSFVDSFGPSGMQSALYNGAGQAYEIRKQHDKAGQYYLKSLQVSRQIGNKIASVNSLVLLAGNAYNKRDYQRAKVYATNALELSNSIKNKIQMPKIVLLLENIHEKEGNYKEALDYNRLYLRYKDSLANENIQNQAMEKEYKYALEKREYNNRLLLNRNRIQTLVLKQKNYLAAGLLTGMVLLTIIFFMSTRQRKIKTDQQKIYLEQKLLRTQMNPHFIFNALQAIQNVVLNNDKQQAVKYLSLFAGLTREVLNNSKEDLITISREIALVEHYLQLQKLRFGERFNYCIFKDSHIDDHIFVPPMLGQPFIENAVEHGMKNIGWGGEIEVHYILTGEMLNIRITDNGHGMNIHHRNNKQHQSMAIAITRERIQVMNKKQKIKIGFEMKDAFPSEKERKGVCIMFNLPVNFIV